MADKEISELTAAGTLTGTEIVHLVQGGNSRQVAISLILALVAWEDINGKPANLAGFGLDTEVNTLISNAVAALVDSSPEALDTLNELAAALGDDPNFASTMTTALAGKVPTGRSISVGAGLSGGGDLSSDRTISLSLASQAEAEAGTENTKPMTALRVAQAIAALGGSPSYAIGAVGTYGQFKINSGKSPGDTISGGNLEWAAPRYSGTPSLQASGSPSGTWRVMCYVSGGLDHSCIALRIS